MPEAAQKHLAEETALPAAQCQSMPEIRREIDRVDRALVQLLAERMSYIERAGVIKKDRGTVRDEARIADVLSKVELACAREGFPFLVAEPVWRALMEGCIAHEFVVWDEVHAGQVRGRRSE